MNHPIEELKPLLSELDTLSEGCASKYVVATEALSHEYFASLQEMGIRGVVLMPWSMMEPASEPLDEKLKAMAEAARYWL